MGRAQRTCFLSLGARHPAGRVMDLIALNWELETLEADAAEAYDQVPDREEVIVEPALEYLDRLTWLGNTRA